MGLISRLADTVTRYDSVTRWRLRFVVVPSQQLRMSLSLCHASARNGTVAYRLLRRQTPNAKRRHADTSSSGSSR